MLDADVANVYHPAGTKQGDYGASLMRCQRQGLRADPAPFPATGDMRATWGVNHALNPISRPRLDGY